MAIINGSFTTQSQAEDAVARLEQAGFAEGDIGVVSHADDAVGAPDDVQQRTDHALDTATAGAVVGAVIGGALFGPIGAVVAGAAAGGGLIASLHRHGMSEEEARDYEERLHQGRYVVSVRVPDDAPERLDAARVILQVEGADRIATRRD